MRRIVKQVLILLFLPILGFAQERTITGTVVSTETKDPLPGVNVFLKGTTNGVTTDLDGNYRIVVPQSGGTLVFSFIGLGNESVQIGSENVINVEMSDSFQELDEIIVTGYSVQSREKVISTVDVVSSKEIADVPTPSVDQALQGRAAGVISTLGSGQPGSQSDIVIRGTGSISGSSAPLYVIDGIIVSNSNISTQATGTRQSPLASLNPNDIESVSILKDASATALYGARGANGVVVITTKSGKEGKTEFGFSMQLGRTQRNKGGFEMMSAKQLWEYERAVLTANGLDPDNPSSPDSRPLSYLAENADTDWLGEAFDLGNSNKYEFSANGGNDKSSFFSSIGYFKQSGVLLATNFERFSGRLNFKHHLTEKLILNMNTSLSWIKQRQAANGNTFTSPLLGAWLNRPFDAAYTNGVPTPAGIRGSNVRWQSLTRSNFVREVDQTYYRNRTLRTINSISLNYVINDNFSLTTNNGFDYLFLKQTNWQSPISYDGQGNRGELYRDDNINYTLTTSNLLNFNKTWGDWGVTALLGFEAQKNTRTNIGAAGTGFASSDLQTLQSAAKTAGVDGFDTEYFFISYFGQLNLDYLSKYFTTVSVRHDGSSRFGSNKRFATFWSAGASWLMNKEQFLENAEWLDQLKVRVSIGTSGNADIGNFASRTLFSGSASYVSNPGLIPSQIGNADLTWEKNINYNAGFDLGVFNRVSVTMDLYYRKSTNMLLSKPVPLTTGYSSLTENVGSLENKGFEVLVNSQNVKGDFNWTTDLNVAVNRNKVLSLPDGEGFSNPSTSRQRVEEGRPVRSFYLRKWAGVDRTNGNPLWYLADGSTTSNYREAPRQFVGNAAPKLTAGMTNTVSYKGVSLSFFLYWVYGSQIYNSTSSFYDASGNRYGIINQVKEAIDFWRPDNSDAPRPKPRIRNSLASSPSTRYLESGSFLRLRNVTLSYNLPVDLIKKVYLKNARIYFQGQNLLTWTNYKGIDPEVDITGTEFFRYPVGKVYTIGLDIKF